MASDPSPPEARLREFIEAAKVDVYGEAPDAEAALLELVAAFRELRDVLRYIENDCDNPRAVAHEALRKLTA